MIAFPTLKDRVFVPADPIDEIERRPMTYETFLEFASESQKMEWVDDEVLIYMSASTKHQSIFLFLVKLFGLFIDHLEVGEVFTDPFLCKLWDGGPAREPDIIWIAPDNPGRLDDKRFYGAPDLVVEIVSPGSVRQDTFKKFAEYEEAGVREYWIVDPRWHYQTVDLYVRNEQGKFDVMPPDVDGCLYSTILPGFWMDTNWLWESPFPRPQLKVAEVMLTLPDLPDDLRMMYQVIVNTLQ